MKARLTHLTAGKWRWFYRPTEISLQFWPQMKVALKLYCQFWPSSKHCWNWQHT